MVSVCGQEHPTVDGEGPHSSSSSWTAIRPGFDRITSCLQPCLELKPHCGSHFSRSNHAAHHLHVLGMLGCLWHSTYAIVEQLHGCGTVLLPVLCCACTARCAGCYMNVSITCHNSCVTSLPERPFGPAARTYCSAVLSIILGVLAVYILMQTAVAPIQLT